MQRFDDPTLAAVALMETIVPEKMDLVHFCHICGRALRSGEALVCECGFAICSGCLELCRGA
jgi:hypothetical protein